MTTASITMLLLCALLLFLFVPSTQNLQSHPTAKSFLSFPMYHIEYFTRYDFKDEQSLVLARLARDKARLEYLAFIFNRNLGSNFVGKKIDYVTTSLFERMGSYIVALKAGSNRQSINLLLDTASSLVWWQCQPCATCYRSEYPVFDPKLSSSFRTLSCFSDDCQYGDGGRGFLKGCTDPPFTYCAFNESYLDGSIVKGIIASDKIYTEHDQQFEINLTFGCARQTAGIFGTYSGILGFNQHSLSFPKQMGIYRFSFCLVQPLFNKSVPFYMGDFPHVDSSQYVVQVPLIFFRDQYYVEFSGVEVSGEMTPVNPEVWRIDENGNYGAIIDTGTTVTRFPADVYNTFRDIFKLQVLFKESGTTVDDLDTCYELPTEQFLNMFPTVVLHFTDKGNPLVLDSAQTLMPAYDGLYCLAFAATSHDVKVTIIGSWQLQRTSLDFDLLGKTVSLIPNVCRAL